MNKFLNLNNLSEKKKIDLLINLLKNKKIAIVIKTDTVYGIISKSAETIGKAKLRNIKEKKIIQFISKINQIENNLPTQLSSILKNFWPGPLTLIYKKIGYRIPDHKLLIEVINKIGPIYASSANITNNPVISNIKQAQKEFKNSEVLIYFADEKYPENTKNKASTIFDWDNLKIIRKGSINKKEILKAMEQNNS